MRTDRLLRLLVLGGALAAGTGQAAPGADDTAFFESRIRPLLVDRCLDCHGERKAKGGLRLDSAAGWRTGGDTGPALIPGRPTESLLIKAVHRTDPDLQMPPDEPLRPDEVALLEEWVARGAPDPRQAAPTPSHRGPMTLAEAEAHWAFRPVVAPATPAGVHPVDHLIRARLSTEGLGPNPPAAPRTLVRRAYFTLLGLPPSYERIEQFAADPSPAAWAVLLDQLLARPEYGQRWGRHWLDVARYADTTEKSVDGERRIPFAHTYRDYVIGAFNADLPFDRFVREQVAADRLPADERPDLRALGFLTVGRRFEGNLEAKELIIDDRIDVIGRGLLGLTLSCARCHDHKFDAVTAADYYGLSGILASSRDPLDLPEIGQAPDTAEVAKYRKDRADLFCDYENHLDAVTARAARLLRELAPEYLRYLVAESPRHRTVEGFVPLDTPRGLLVRGGPPRWAATIDATLRQGLPFFRLWPQFLALPREGFASAAEQVLATARADPGRHDPRLLAALSAKAPASMEDVADVFGQVLTASLESAEPDALAAFLNAPDSPLRFTREEIREDVLRFVTEHQLVARRDGEAAAAIREKLTTLEASAPVERAQVITVRGAPEQPRVLLRGDRLKPGPEVPRRLPRLLAGVDDRSFSGDGRLELARALASPRNPLTARVIVNRVWQQHFGRGLVATPDDFGASGERPSHPELLDHLAAWFMDRGWSLKALHRHLMTSETWRQSGMPRAEALARDPENRLVWHLPARRLEFEPLRDSLLRVAGRLDPRTGGRSAPLDDGNVRRAVYGYTDRYRIPALLRNFDVANPDQSIGRRAETTHPLQALYFLNSPFVQAQAEWVNRQPDIIEQAGAPERIRATYCRVLARQPAREELGLAQAFLGDSPDAARWTAFTQGLLMSNEFSFID